MNPWGLKPPTKSPSLDPALPEEVLSPLAIHLVTEKSQGFMILALNTANSFKENISDMTAILEVQA